MFGSKHNAGSARLSGGRCLRAVVSKGAVVSGGAVVSSGTVVSRGAVVPLGHPCDRGCREATHPTAGGGDLLRRAIGSGPHVVPHGHPCDRGRPDRTHPNSGGGSARSGDRRRAECRTSASPLYPGASRHDAPDRGGRRLAPRLGLTALAASFLLALFCIAFPAAPPPLRRRAPASRSWSTSVRSLRIPRPGCAADPAERPRRARAGRVLRDRGGLDPRHGLPDRRAPRERLAPQRLPRRSTGRTGAPSPATPNGPIRPWAAPTPSPEAGDVEGWSFGDGSAPPDREPADAAAAAKPPNPLQTETVRTPGSSPWPRSPSSAGS